jgi:CheY-like chemotaxis protein
MPVSPGDPGFRVCLSPVSQERSGAFPVYAIARAETNSPKRLTPSSSSVTLMPKVAAPHRSALVRGIIQNQQKRIAMILYIGTNSGDCQVVRNIVDHLGVPEKLRIIGHGESAADYLQGRGLFNNRAALSAPSVIFIESTLAGIGGWKVLEMFKASDEFRWVPVVMVVPSDTSGDMRHASSKGACACLRSPLSDDGLQRLFTASGDFATMTSDRTTAGVGPS